MDIYVMVFNALKEAEEKRIAEMKKGGGGKPSPEWGDV